MDFGDAADRLIALMGSHFRTRTMDRFRQFSKGEFFVLSYIVEKDGKTPAGEISARLGSSAARVAAVLGRLERKGLVSREIDSQDRRRILVSAAGDAGALVASEKQAMRARMERALRLMGERDAKEFIRTLRKFVEAAECGEWEGDD
jgi:DNA-binding MarR family transcriptional regulator